MDPNSALVVPDSQRTLYSVRQAQQTGHNIIFGSQPGIEVLGNPHDFIPFIQCPQSGLWLLKLYPPQHNKVYPVFNNTTPTQASQALTQEQRLNDHQRLGHISQKRQRELDIEGITKPSKKARLTPLTCPVSITAKLRRHARPQF